MKGRKQLIARLCFKKTECESLIGFLPFLSYYRKVIFCMGTRKHVLGVILATQIVNSSAVFFHQEPFVLVDNLLLEGQTTLMCLEGRQRPLRLFPGIHVPWIMHFSSAIGNQVSIDCWRNLAKSLAPFSWAHKKLCLPLEIKFPWLLTLSGIEPYALSRHTANNSHFEWRWKSCFQWLLT